METVKDFCKSLCVQGWNRHTLIKLSLALEANAPWVRVDSGLDWPTDRKRQDYSTILDFACRYLEETGDERGLEVFIGNMAVDFRLADISKRYPQLSLQVMARLARSPIDWGSFERKFHRTVASKESQTSPPVGAFLAQVRAVQAKAA